MTPRSAIESVVTLRCCRRVLFICDAVFNLLPFSTNPNQETSLLHLDFVRKLTSSILEGEKTETVL